MKTYSTVVSCREMSKFVKIHDEFWETEMKVVLRLVQKKKERFIGLFISPFRVTKTTIPFRDRIREFYSMKRDGGNNWKNCITALGICVRPVYILA